MNLSNTIQNKTWRAAWPSQVVETLEDGAVPDVPWKGQMVRYRRLFGALEGQGNCGFKEMQEFLDRMQAWSDRHAVYFNFPSNMDGFRRAVWATLSEPQGKDDMAWLWAGYGPSVRLALSEKPSDPHWANAFQKAIESSLKEKVDVAPVVSPDPATKAPLATSSDASSSFTRDKTPDLASKLNGYAKRPTTPAAEEPASVIQLREWLQAALMASMADKPEGILQEEFDETLKRHAAEKALNARVLSNWVEYDVFPAVAGLPAPLLQRFTQVWPESHTSSFGNPERTLSTKRFWAILEDVKSPAREVMFEEVLPKLINTDQWDSPLRFNLAKHMLSWTFRRPEAFEERLQLWLRWGGRFNDAPAVVIPENHGRFTSATPELETVESWIRAQNNPEITQILERNQAKAFSRRMSV